MGLRYYQFAGLTLASELPLPLSAAEGVQAGVELSLMQAGSGATLPRRWQSAHPVRSADAEAGGLALFADAGDFLLRYAGCFDLVLEPQLRRASFHPCRGSDEATVEHLLLDQALPRILGHYGHLMLHASAVDIGGRALCFVAPSGAGKSTLAALLARNGHRVMADDVVRLRAADTDVRVHPGYPSLRLWDDSAALLSSDHVQSDRVMATYSSKRDYRLDHAIRAEGDRRLGALVLLGSQQDPSVTAPRLLPVAPAAALIRMMGQCFSLLAQDGGALPGRLRGMAAVCARAAPSELSFRHDYALSEPLLAALRPLLDHE